MCRPSMSDFEGTVASEDVHLCASMYEAAQQRTRKPSTGIVLVRAANKYCGRPCLFISKL
jgi:hypothetical protein